MSCYHNLYPQKPINIMNPQYKSSNTPNDSYWKDFYRTDHGLDSPSPFAETCFKELHIRSGDKVIEFGCGNGRDSKFFSDKNAKVLAIDPNAPLHKNPDFFFMERHMNETPNISCDVVYSRFFLHAITPSEERAYYRYIKKNATKFCFEVRSDVDAFEGDHYRRFFNKEKLMKRLDEHNFSYLLKESRGFAKFKGEDPMVIRVFGYSNAGQ